jgi:hypothetical protein
MIQIIVLIILILAIVFREDIRYFIDVNSEKFNNVHVDINKSNFNSKKIIIYSADNRNDKYIKLHKQGWENYSKIHGYTFIFEDPCSEVPVYYCKFKKILQLMEKYKFDYFIWVDSDSIPNKVFKNFNLESMIQQVGEDTDVITTYYILKDLFKALVGSFYVFKNSNNARLVLQKCLDYIDHSKWESRFKAKTLYGGKQFEEAAMFYVLKQNPQVIHKRITGKFITNGYQCTDDFFIIHNPDKNKLEKCFQKVII